MIFTRVIQCAAVKSPYLLVKVLYFDKVLDFMFRCDFQIHIWLSVCGGEDVQISQRARKCVIYLKREGEKAMKTCREEGTRRNYAGVCVVTQRKHKNAPFYRLGM